jgi:GTP-binding protein LepA
VVAYAKANVEKVIIFVASEPVEALSFIVHKDKAYDLGKKICERLRDELPR